jgi:hypothetical protein
MGFFLIIGSAIRCTDISWQRRKEFNPMAFCGICHIFFHGCCWLRYANSHQRGGISRLETDLDGAGGNAGDLFSERKLAHPRGGPAGTIG